MELFSRFSEANRSNRSLAFTHHAEHDTPLPYHLRKTVLTPNVAFFIRTEYNEVESCGISYHINISSDEPHMVLKLGLEIHPECFHD